MLIKIFERGIYMITELDLPQDRFNVVKLKDIKKKTFIYGKNGTGKSSIVECIQKQYSNEYDIKVFQGYERIIADYGKLGLISLGVENVEIQKQIKEKEAEIKLLEADLDGTPRDRETLQKSYNKQKEVVKKIELELDEFYRESAKKLKDEYVNIVGPSYFKNHFLSDIEELCEFSAEEVNDAKKNIAQESIKPERLVGYSLSFINDLVDKVNQIRTMEILNVTELKFDNEQERKWVESGVGLHQDHNHCLYCGGIISNDRKNVPNNHFNAAHRKLSEDIRSCKNQIEDGISFVNKLPLLEKINYLSIYENQVNELNARAGIIKKTAIDFIEKLKENLINKAENIFLVLPIIHEFELEEVTSFTNDCDALYEKNHENVENLTALKEKAKVIIRNDLVAERCRAFNYAEKNLKLQAEKAELQKLNDEVDDKRDKLNILREDVKALQLQTVDEGKAAEYINRAIQGLGNQSFSLEKSEERDENGVYVVRDHSGEIRNTETLSTGEKNIVAFLWFIHNLQNLNHQSTKEEIIIFDDPMNSNDDTTQYLIISELQSLLKASNSQIFILTHNAHFYINTRYQWWRRESSTKATYRLTKRGKKSDVIRIEREADDIKTSYDGLWREVKWLYEQDKPDFMLNPIRRILETYKKFNCIDDLFAEHKEAEKLFNVNSHSIDDLECDPNGKSRDEIIELVRMVFESKGAENHFKAHWDENID